MSFQSALLRDQNRVHKFHALPIPAPGLLACSALILASVYDKSGLIVNLGQRSVSVSFFKLLFLALIVFYLLDPVRSRRKFSASFDRRLFWLIAGFIVVQTITSFLGLYFAPGSVSIPSEIYYLIQRGSFLFIPMLALRYNMTPKSVLKVFIAAVILHDLFILLQFVSPVAYRSFAEWVNDPLRLDNGLGWTDRSWNFIGLQTTSNYGSFVASFGLLVLAFTPRTLPQTIVKWTILLLAVSIALLGPARSVFIMTAVALLLFAKRTGRFSRFSTYFTILLFLTLVFSIQIFGIFTFRLKDFTSIHALVQPEVKEASTEGKLRITHYGFQLFLQSPVVGWGQRPFSLISEPLGNQSYFTSETHSYALSTLLSTGLIGLIAYLAVFVGITKALWRNKSTDFAILGGMFIGLNIYNIIYDAGGLDVFACFNGVVAYYALRSHKGSLRCSPLYRTGG